MERENKNKKHSDYTPIEWVQTIGGFCCLLLVVLLIGLIWIDSEILRKSIMTTCLIIVACLLIDMGSKKGNS